MLADDLRELGWTSGELSRRLGVHRNTVSKWMTKGKVPRYCEAYLELALKLKGLKDSLG